MSGKDGYVYRVAQCSTTALRALITEHVKQGIIFETTYLELRYPRAFSDANEPAIMLDGSGQAWGADAEVRWRPCDADTFDVLLLLAKKIATGEGMEEIIGPWKLYEPPHAKVLPMSKNDTSKPEGASVRYVEYRAPNGAVQFVRHIQGKTS